MGDLEPNAVYDSSVIIPPSPPQAQLTAHWKILTPSRGDHGLGGRIAFWVAKARKSPKLNMAMELHILIVQRMRDFPGRTYEQGEVFICME